MCDEVLLRALAGDREAMRAVKLRQVERRERRLASQKHPAAPAPPPTAPATRAPASCSAERDELVTGALRGAATWLTTPRGVRELRRPAACRATVALTATPEPREPALGALLPLQPAWDATNHEALGHDRMALLGALDSKFKRESDLAAQVESLADSIEDKAAKVAALREALAAAQQACRGIQEPRRDSSATPLRAATTQPKPQPPTEPLERLEASRHAAVR
jgi:hypothetical protein